MTVPDPPTRTQLLARLPDLGFVPPDGATPEGTAAAAFTAAVENLALTFWDLAPAERRACWNALRGQNDSPAAARLADLEPGLDVTPARQTDRHAAELGRVVRELFTLPPRARAARRRDWLTTNATPFGVWAVAAAELAADRPTAGLDPLLIHRLRNAHVPAAVPPTDPASGGGDPLDGTLWLAQRDAQERRDARRRTSDRLIAAALALFVVPFVIVVAMGIKTCSNAPRPVAPSAPPAPQMTISKDQLEELMRRSRTTSTTFRALSGWAPDPPPARPTRR
jgi:hypothetical protein